MVCAASHEHNMQLPVLEAYLQRRIIELGFSSGSLKVACGLLAVCSFSFQFVWPFVTARSITGTAHVVGGQAYKKQHAFSQTSMFDPTMRNWKPVTNPVRG